MFFRRSLMSGVSFYRAAEGGEGGGEGGEGGKKPADKTYNEDYVAGLRREAQGYRERLTAVETEFKAFRDTSAAALQTAKDEATAAGARANETLKDSALRLAAKEAGMRDVDALKMLDTTGVKVDVDGKVTIPDKFFEDAKKAKGYLFEEGAADTGSTSGTPKTPAVPKPGALPDVRKMTDVEYAAAKAAAVKV